MKKTLLILFLMLLGSTPLGAAPFNSEKNDLDSIRVSLEARNISLREALQALVSQTKLQIVYSDALVKDIEASYSGKNVTLREALDGLLAPAALDYRVMEDDQIVIIKRVSVTPKENLMPGGPSGRGLPGRPGFPAGRRFPNRFDSAVLGGGAPSAGPLQGRGFAAGGGPEDVAPAIKALKLSEQQKGEVEAIWQAHQEKGRELLQKRERGEIDFAALRSAHDKLNEELLQQMKSVLNEEQYKKLKQAIARSEP